MEKQSTYKHGGDILSFSKQIQAHPSEVIDLSSNINFVTPNITLDFNQLSIASYPNYQALYESVGKLYKVKTEQIELFNGATSAISSFFRELDTKECTLYAPLYGEYEKIAELQSLNIQQINRFENLYEKVKERSLVIFVNPSTPDGKLYQLEKLMQHWQEQNCTIFIDESFLDFSQGHSLTAYLEKYSKLYILKSMTKFYAAAGIRIGLLLSSAKNIKKIKQHEPLWKISEFDSHYLQFAIKDRNFEERSQKENALNKAYLIALFKTFKYTDSIYPSSTNFILIKLKSINANELQEKLLPYKIMLRNCENFQFLDNQHVRVAVKSKEKLKILENALKKII